jgi:phosphoribosyl 1,2-cyclic phosphate phosphodiesterase
MELIFLGTAAAEGLPAPFCSCDICAKARSLGGKNHRLRSAVLIDRVLKIDNGPDTVAQSQKFGICFDTVTNIVFTHTHEDHLEAEGVLLFVPPFTNTMKRSLTLYGPPGIAECVMRSATYPWAQKAIDLKPVLPFEKVTTSDGYVITPLLAHHVSERLCLNHIVTAPGGKSVLYATDTGAWPDSTWAYLEKERPSVDIAVMEATHGTMELKAASVHLNFAKLLEHRKRLMELGIVKKKTPFFATHFSHNGAGTHEDMAAYLKGEGVAPAYDGLTVEV